MSKPFSDDTLAYFTEGLDPEVTRPALAATLRHAKRNKAFENTWRIGLAVDGTGAGYTTKEPCPLCHPVKDKEGHLCGHLHHLVMITVAGTGLTLPLDVEPYGPTVMEAYWHTNFSLAELPSGSFYRLAKSRWEVENQGFNDGKNRYGMEHIRHHEPNSLLVCWLLIPLALVIERLYRLRHLHRGDHGIRSAIHLADFLWLNLCGPPRLDSS